MTNACHRMRKPFGSIHHPLLVRTKILRKKKWLQWIRSQVKGIYKVPTSIINQGNASQLCPPASIFSFGNTLFFPNVPCLGQVDKMLIGQHRALVLTANAQLVCACLSCNWALSDLNECPSILQSRLLGFGCRGTYRLQTGVVSFLHFQGVYI